MTYNTKIHLLAFLLLSFLTSIATPLHAQTELVAPENVEGTAVSRWQLLVKFLDNNTTEDAYEIHYAVFTDGPFEVDTVSAEPGSDTVVAYLDVEPGLPYTVKVRAFVDPETYGPFSEPIVVETPRLYPGPASQPNTESTGDAIRVTWWDADDEHAYILQRTTNDQLDWQIELPANTTEFLDTTAVSGITYQYGIQSVNEFGGSQYPVKWIFGSIDHHGLIAPLDVTTNGKSPDEFEVRFTDNNDHEDAYEIVYSTSPDGPFMIWHTGSNPPDSAVYAAIPGMPGTTYYIKVRAFIDEVGFSPFTQIYTVSTLPGGPVAPSDLTLTQVNEYLQLNWTDNADDEAGYVIRREAQGYPTVRFTVPANKTSFLDTTVVGGVTYTYLVYGVNATGYPGEGVRVTGTAKIYPASPTNFTVKTSGKAFRLTWTDNATNEAYYVVSKSGEGVSDEYFWLPANTTEFVDTDVVPGIIYTYGLAAVTEEGEGKPMIFVNASLKKKGAAGSAAVYPNPAASFAEVTFDKQMSGQVQVKIVDGSNNVRIATQFDIHNEKSIRINNLSELSAGHYFLNVSLPNGEVMREHLFIE